MNIAGLNDQIISALQINPRISWSRLGAILSADPTTLSRRWQRLFDDGLVWTTCFEPAPRATRSPVRAAGVEIFCAPGERDALIESLSNEPLCYSVQCTSGDRDLLAMISGPSLLTLDDLVQQRVVIQPGVLRTRTHYLHTVYRQGSDWRLQALSDAQSLAVAQTLPPAQPQARPKRIHRELIAALNPDLRVSLAQLGESTGYSTPTLARALEVVFAADWARFRVDLAHEHSGWETEALLWMHVDSMSLARLGQALTQMPEVRLCASISGKANLTVSIWLRRLGDIADFEHRLCTLEPGLRIVDRWIVPRVAKRFGHVLDARGLHERYVPIGVPEILTEY